MTIDSAQYRHQIFVAKQVNFVADNILEKDQKKKFLMRGYPPVPEQLEEHEVGINFEKYFPYLLYYYEPDIYPWVHEAEEYEDTMEYLRDLFHEQLEIVSPEREEPLLITDEEYDELVNNNFEKRQEALKKLSEYEKDIFSFTHDLTLERLQSADVAINLERFLPFLMQIAEPSLNKHIPIKSEKDWPEVKKYVNDILAAHMEFADEE